MSPEAVRSETPVYSEDVNTTMMTVGFTNTGCSSNERRKRAKSEPGGAVGGAEEPEYVADKNEPKQRSGSTNRGYVRSVKNGHLTCSHKCTYTCFSSIRW